MSDKNLPKLYESVKGLTEGATKGLSSINPISAISNAADGIMSHISNMFVKSKDCKARIVESDNTKEVEIVKSNNDVKVEVIKGSFGLAVNVTENIEGVTNICRELKEASIGIAKIKADLNIHIANLDFEDRNNDRKFQMWMKKTDYDLIKFKESSNSVRHTLDEYLKSINDTRREIMSIPTNTLNQSEIQYRTELLSDIKEIRKHISDLLIKLMEM
ncbi:hypothetical protein R4K92_14660 [Brachyspira intermedia]|uniref:hypothetical protein n=2 Tax=Brachyspira intermedia TaxID=84377 RepID=UPI003004EC01